MASNGGRKFFPGRVTFYATLFACLILVLAVVIYGRYKKSESVLNETVMARRHDLASASAMIVKTQFDGLVDLGVSLAERPLVRQYAEAGRWYEAIGVYRADLSEFRMIERLFMTDTGGVMASDLPVASPSVIGQSRADKDWYKGVSRTGRPYVSEIYLREAEPRINIISVAVPIKDAEDAAVGYLVMQVRIEKILAWLNDIQPASPSFMYLADQHGGVLGHP